VFNYRDIIDKFVRGILPTNAAEAYEVEILPVPVPAGEWYWKVLGVYHLTPDENRGMRNLFLETIDADQKRLRSEIGWRWVGQKPSEKVRPVVLDKPLDEPGGNIAMDFGQTISAWVEGSVLSEIVAAVHTRHPNELGGNTVGHHSFFVVWQLTQRGGEVPTPQPKEPAHKVLLEIKVIIDKYLSRGAL
jgi:hypothetical protein